MQVTNAHVAAVLDEIGRRLAIRGDNPFRANAYRDAARTVRNSGPSVAEAFRAAEPPKLVGIGPDLSAKIREIDATGTSRLLERLRAEYPASLLELLSVPGLGPKRVRLIYDRLGVGDLQSLASAAKEGKLRGLPGLSARTEARILAAVAAHPEGGHGFLHGVVRETERMLRLTLAGAAGVSRLSAAGDFRRGRETVGDLPFVAGTRGRVNLTAALRAFPETLEAAQRGGEATARLRSGLLVSVTAAPAAEFGTRLIHATGSEPHWRALVDRAADRGLILGETGLFEGRRKIAGSGEEEVYAALGLSFIPPELRETGEEVELAAGRRLPRLIERRDLRGDLHSHTTETDGKNSLIEMAEAAKRAGLEYLAVTDHSKRLSFINGMNEDRLLHQMDEIDRLNERLEGLVLLKGVEVDILEDGSLDMADDVLARTDVVIASVHGHFGLSKTEQTERVLRAMENRYVTVIGHPSARRLGHRSAIALDIERIITGALERGCALEINGQPQRLDLNDEYCRLAVRAGVRLSVASDAHGVGGFAHLDYALTQARRGWVERDNVLNTLPLPELRAVVTAMR